MILLGKTDTAPAHIFRTRIGRHDQNHIAEIGLAPVVVGQRAVIHHLQQQIENLGVRLLDLVEQYHAVRMLGHCIGQQAALIETDIARRRTDQPRYGMTLHVLGHIESESIPGREFSPAGG